MVLKSNAYLNDMPYCETDSKPDFQTRVTSQAFVACNRHDKNAETAFPPTIAEVSHTQICDYEWSLFQRVDKDEEGTERRCSNDFTHLRGCVVLEEMEPLRLVSRWPKPLNRTSR